MHPQRRVLGLFAKQPLPGEVKTRLAAAVSAEWAAGVAQAFLLDTIDRIEAVDAQRVLCFSPPEARSYFAKCAAGGFTLMPQVDGDLGCRMAAFFAQQFQEGAEAVVLIGSDSPTLPVAFIELAFEMLQQANIVLGPAHDGGYYLIGCTRLLPAIFDGIPWGSNRVLEATVEAVGRAGGRLELLPKWFDVDTLEVLRMLKVWLTTARQFGIDPGVPHTEQLLQEPLP